MSVDYLSSMQAMQSNPYLSLLSQYKPNILQELLSKFGGGVLSGIGGMLAGPTWQEKSGRALAGRLQRQENQPMVQQSQINALYPQLMAQAMPGLNQAFSRGSQRVGMDSGAAQGEASRYLSETLKRLMGGVQTQSMFMNAQAPLQRQQLLSQLVR